MKLTAHNLSKSIYGIILFCSIMLTVEHLDYSAGKIIAVLLGSMLLIALAESYAEIIGTKAKNQTFISKGCMKDIIKDSLAVFIGSEIPVVLFGLAYFSVISLPTAFLLSKILIVLLLFGYSYETSRLAQRSRVKSLITAVISITFAITIIVLKSLWH